jgi:hypothetical protein
VSEVRWEGRSHQEIYDAVQQGPGAAISAAAADAWTGTAALIERIDQRITAAITGSQAGWEGSAADATRSAMTPLGQWALDAANDAKITASAVQTQAEQAQKLRADMPPPLTEQRDAEVTNALTDPTYIFHGLDDLQAIEQQSANEAARAVDLMNQYTNNSYENRRNMDFWTLPPQVTVVTEPAGVGPAGPGGPGVPAPTPPAEAPAPPTGGPPPPGAATPPAVTPPGGPGAAIPPAITPPVPPGGPGATPGGPPVPPTVVPPAPGQPPGGTAPAAVPPAPVAPAAPALPSPPTQQGGTQPPGGPGAPVLPPGAIPPGQPGGTTPGGVRPVVPGAPPRPTSPPSWRDIVPGAPTAPGSRFPAPAAPDADRTLPPPGTRAAPEPPGARGTVEPAARAAATAAPAGTRPGVPGAAGGLYPPLAPGLGAGSEQERHRPDYLLDDSDAFADDRWFTPAVITPDDGPPPVRR